MIKKIVWIAAGLLIVIQFFRPEKNLTNDRTYDISTNYFIPASVHPLLENACNDCHSNKTNYPWYSNIQPVSWWLDHHVTDGKRHLNFSTFTKLPIAVQNHKLEEVVETVKEKEMPLPSYTWLGLHGNANLSEEERVLITSWAQSLMDSLKAHYPPDSLILKKRPRPEKS